MLKGRKNFEYESGSRRTIRLHSAMAGAGLVGVLLVGSAEVTKAASLYDGSEFGNNLEINLNTTISYSTFYRVNNPSAILLSGPSSANYNDGDLDFRHGFVSNEFEAVPILDIKDGNYGAHFSGEFYLNTPYLGTTQNDQPSTTNPFSIAKSDDFTSATRNINGENARLLDAFVFGRHVFNDGSVFSLKVGRQTLLWGQSLFFPENGIAAGQAPLDIITAESLPNPQAQQVFLPVGQVVGTYQFASGLTVQGYYQFEYQHDVFEGVGSYFSSADLLDKGGQRVIFAPGEYLYRLNDLTPPSQNGQFGLSLQDSVGNYDLGLYALRFDDKAPEVYGSAGPSFGAPTKGGIYVGDYQIVYPRDIQVYGASVSTTLGPANVAGEISGRRNMPLWAANNGFTIIPAGAASANAGARYPVGDTLAAQASTIYATPTLSFDPGGISFAGEIAFNHLISVTANRSDLAPGRQASAAAVEFVVTPTYYGVLPNLTVTFPVGIQYNILGRSEIDPSMQHGTGNFTTGITGTYKVNWIASLTYKDFLGKPDSAYNDLADRGYVALNLQHTF
jgi:hypothetical protein